MEGSDELEDFVEITTGEVYRGMNVLIGEMEYVLSGTWREWIEVGNGVVWEVAESVVRKDYEHLLKMREMDEEIRSQRQGKR
jgi:hypothetical protein